MNSQSHKACPRTVVMLGFPGAQVLDITGPLEIFKGAADVLARRGCTDNPAYEIIIATADGGVFETSCGIKLVADDSLAAIDFPIDTLLVSGGSGTGAAMADKRVTGFLRDAAKTARRVASVCSGAFLLARAGLLDGRRTATHWDSCDLLARNFPKVDVDRDALYVQDGKYYGSAGVTAGMDLALALVAEDCGRDVALEVAKDKVLFMMRGGGQSQFSTHLMAQTAETPQMRGLLNWVTENVHADLNVAALAAQAVMSPRNFARTFVKETGTTPAQFVECARVDAARRRLEESGDGVDRIADQCGFGSSERMRRAFHRQIGVSPNAYRDRFQVHSK